MAMAQQIVAVTSIPASSVPPTDATLATNVFFATCGSMLNVWGTATAGSGNGYLLRWMSDINGHEEWSPWGADAAGGYVSLNSATNSGKFNSRFVTGAFTTGYYLFLAAGVTFGATNKVSIAVRQL